VNPEEIENLLARTSSYVASLAPHISTPKTGLQLAFEALKSPVKFRPEIIMTRGHSPSS